MNVWNFMGKQSGPKDLSVITWVSTFEGCPLAGFHCILDHILGMTLQLSHNIRP